jgi:hypothetical protein
MAARHLQPGTFVLRPVRARHRPSAAGHGTYRPLLLFRQDGIFPVRRDAATGGHSGRRPRTIERTPERAKGSHRRSRSSVTNRATMSHRPRAGNASGADSSPPRPSSIASHYRGAIVASGSGSGLAGSPILGLVRGLASSGPDRGGHAIARSGRVVRPVRRPTDRQTKRRNRSGDPREICNQQDPGQAARGLSIFMGSN